MAEQEQKIGIGSLLKGIGEVIGKGVGAVSGKEAEFIKDMVPDVSKDESFLNMLMNDMEGKVDDETKDFYYKTIIPRLFKEAQTDSEKRKLKKIGYEDTLLDKMSLKELIDLLNSEEGTFTDSSIYRPGAAKGGMPTGIMTTNKAGVMERDYRDKGGFVPVGIKEKADDVPAMLSKNEFVFTADAVRGAGNGSIEKGAQRMYDTMKKLEKRVV